MSIDNVNWDKVSTGVSAAPGLVNSYIDAFTNDYRQSVDFNLDADGRADFGAIDQSRYNWDLSPITDIGTGISAGAKVGGGLGAVIGGGLYAVPAIVKTAKQISAHSKFKREKQYAYRNAARMNGMLSDRDEVLRNFNASLMGEYQDFYG